MHEHLVIDELVALGEHHETVERQDPAEEPGVIHGDPLPRRGLVVRGRAALRLQLA